MGRHRALVVAALLLIGPATIARADGDVAPRSYWDAVGRKLGRGAANVLCAPVELIRMPALIGRRESGVAGLTVGVVQGMRELMKREVAGWIEVVTFPFSFPNEFQPLIRPEFIYSNGDWTPDDGSHNL